jgi:DNA modification methylase
MTPNETSMNQELNSFKDMPRHPVHSFHRYFGKLIPGLPAFAIEKYTKVGDIVLDPFSGSGTTVVEAKEKNRIGIGVDLNPLAILVAKVKTTWIDEIVLTEQLDLIISTMKNVDEIKNIEEPYVVNMDHWFRSEVKQELLKLKSIIGSLEDNDVRDFFLVTFSAFLRGVSNADPQHVFPGFSKRMRKLEAEGRKIDVMASFIRAAKKRIKQIGLISKGNNTTILHTSSFTDANLELDYKVNLIVTNPPYISSIRYLETMKIEMGWLGFLKSQKEYLELDKSVIGTERFYKAELQDLGTVGYAKIDEQISEVANLHPKMAKTVYEYFLQMDKVFENASRLIIKGGHLVIKISDSKVRNQVIATHSHFIDICTRHHFALLHDLIDDFDPNSRSLLTSRNSYSGIMTFDHILIFQRK